MEPSTLPPPPNPPSSPGELVVQGGRLGGSRRAFNDPLTLIGQASGCDIRLSVEGVDPLHCAIFLGDAGPVLRDLGSVTGTRVNGKVVATQRLANGDVIEVGPFQFTVALGTPPTAEVPSSDVVLAEREREALRIQAAAVAAQQAALTEEEIRLEQHASALTRQEEQLARHLQQRLHELDGREAELASERAALLTEVEAQKASLKADRETLAGGQAGLLAERDKAIKERQRLVALRRRLRQRWKRHWGLQERDLANRVAAVEATAGRLQREREQLAALVEKQNGDHELQQRQLRDEWQELALAQQQWEAALNLERAEQQRQKGELKLVIDEAAAARKSVLGQQREAADQHTRLLREAEGLETRISHQRTRLEAIEQRIAAHAIPALNTSTEAIIAPPASLPTAAPPAILARTAEELMDQRSRLAEQWARFLEVQHTWEQDRAAVLSALEQDAAALGDRERRISKSEREVSDVRAFLMHQKETLSRLRLALEAEQTRGLLEQADWQTRRDLLLGEIDDRERLLNVRSQHLEEVHRRRHQRRQDEVARLADALGQAEEARRQYASLWQDCERLREELTRQERTLASRTLALERYRQELITQAPDSVQAEARLARLEKRETSQRAQEAHDLDQQRRGLLAERKRLEALAARLRKQEEDLAAHFRQWEQVRSSHESDEAARLDAEQRRQSELRQLRIRQGLDERQLRQLREELERIAGMLIEDGGESEPLSAAA